MIKNSIKILVIFATFLIMGCAPSFNKITFDQPALIKQWESVKDRQPIIYKDGEPTYERLQQAFDHCLSIATYATDKKVYGQSDFWATPKEYADKGVGDCEDTAICAYYKLAEMGFKDLHLIIGSYYNDGHAVLSVKTTSGYYILDQNYSYPIQSKRYIGKLFQVSMVIQ